MKTVKDLKEGDIIWGFPLKTEDDIPIFLNCYYVRMVVEGLVFEDRYGEQISWDFDSVPNELVLSVIYKSVLNAYDFGLIAFPVKYDLSIPIFIKYGDTEVWCYSNDEKTIVELYEKKLADKLRYKKYFSIFDGCWKRKLF